jgi:hypothetical protein
MIGVLQRPDAQSQRRVNRKGSTETQPVFATTMQVDLRINVANVWVAVTFANQLGRGIQSAPQR